MKKLKPLSYLFSLLILIALSVIPSKAIDVTVGTGTLSSSFPFYTFYEDAKTQFLITPADMGGNPPGLINSIAFNVIANDAATMSGFTIKAQNSALTSLTGFVADGFTTVYTGDYTVPSTGWVTLTFTTPFFWNGSSNLLFEICYNNQDYTANSTVNATAAAGMTWARNADSPAGEESGCVFTGGSAQANRPNVMLSILPATIPYLTAAPSTVQFNYVGAESISAPQTIQIGGDNLSPTSGNLTLTPSFGYQISTNNGTTWSSSPLTVPYTVSPINPTIPVQVRFAPEEEIAYPGTLTIEGGGATTSANLLGTAILSYCIPAYSYTTSLDIARVSVANMENISQAITPMLGRTADATQTYNNYRETAPAINAQAGTVVPYSFNVISSYTYTSSAYMKVYVDLNRDGIINPVSEIVDSLYFTAANMTTNNGLFTRSMIIPPNAVVGQNTLVRFMLSTYATSAPCNPAQYAYGETEDYWINFSAAPPFIAATPVSKDFGLILPGAQSLASDILVQAGSLTPAVGNLTVTPSANYNVSLDGGTSWSAAAVTIPYTNGGYTLTQSNVKVKFVSPSTLGLVYPGTLLISGGNITTPTVVVLNANNMQPYPASTVSLTSLIDTIDIAKVTLANLAFGEASVTPITGRTTAINKYSDNRLAAPQLILNAGSTYQYTVNTYTTGTAMPLCSLSVYIDYNADGDFADAGETVSTVAIPVANNGVATGSFLVPMTAKLDTNNSPRIRFVLSTAAPSATSTTHTVGETEDYRVKVMPALPMTYVSTNTEQVGKPIFMAGSQNEKMLRVKVKVNNAGNPFALNSIVFNTNGTSPVSAITQAKVYFTKDTATFTTNTQIGDALIEPNGSMTFTSAVAPLLGAGDNYVWLVYSISNAAPIDGVIDAELTGLFLSDAPAVNKITVVQAPEGFSLVSRKRFDGSFDAPVFTTNSANFPFNDWTAPTTPTYPWTMRNLGRNNAPACTPYLGSGMTELYGWLVNNATRLLYSPSFPIVTENLPDTVNMWVYRIGTTGTTSLTVKLNTTASVTGATTLSTADATPVSVIPARISADPIVAVAGWYNYSFVIPETYVPGASNYLILEGYGDYVNNIYVDEVKFTDDQDAYMAFAKIDTLTTGNNAFARPSTDNLVNAFNIRTIASNNPFTLNNIKFTPEGTTNIAAIANAKVWYLGNTATFNPATSKLYGSLATVATGQNTVVRTADSAAITLGEGNNYFAITYDVVATATAGNFVDCKLNSITYARGEITTEKVITYGNTWGTHEIKLPMSGTYTVGGTPLTSRWYPNLVDATDELNFLGLAGNVELKIAGNLAIDPLDPPVLLPLTTTGGAYNVTIYPSTNVNITSAYTGTLGMLTIGATDNITIDGRINKTGTARGLTFTNTASGRILMMTTTTANAFIENATVKYCNFVGGLKTAAASIGIQLNNGRHTNVNILNNDFKKVYYGVYTIGGTDTTKLQNLTIDNNNFGDAIVDDNSIGFNAANLAHADNLQFNNNTINNIVTTSSFRAVNITNNVTNSTFANNKFVKLINTGSNSAGAFYINSIANSNINFFSNSVTGLNNNGTGGMTYSPAAFYFNAGTNYKVINNSVRLNGNRSTLSTIVPSSPSSVVYVAAAVAGLDIRNNIFANDLQCAVTTLRNYVIYSLAPDTAFVSINNNNYYVSSTLPLPTIGYIAAADKVTMNDWRTALPVDASSVSTKVTFASATDMHLSGGSACNVLLNCPLADEVIFDMDGNERAATTKMGVDEVFADLEITGQPVSEVTKCVTLGVNNTIEIPVGTFSVSAYSDGYARTFSVGDLEYSWTKNGEAIVGNSAPLQVVFNGATLPEINDVYEATVVSLGQSFNSTTLMLSEGPAIYTLSGSGSLCPNATVGVGFTLSNSQLGVSYQLRLGDTLAVGTPLLGTGEALTFANVTGIGTYKVLAFNTANPTCVSTMGGSATISSLPVATAFTVIGGGTGTGPFAIGLNSSELGVVYKLYRDNILLDAVTAYGTGSPVSFGTYTQAGTYTAKGIRGTCETMMTGNAVIIVPAGGYTVSGTIKYANTAQTAMNNCVVIIKSGTTEVGRDTTDATGNYSVANLENGAYTIEVLTTKAHGGINGLDVSLLRQRIGNTATFTPLQMLAGDINGNGSINGLDVAPLRLKIANTATPQWLVPNYIFYPKTITVDGADSVLDIQSLCGGDVNKSFTPSGN